MKTLISAAAGCALCAGAGYAGGIDRSGQPIANLFKEGNYGEFALGYTDPSVDGNDLITGRPIGNVGGDYFLPAVGVKIDINEKVSFLLQGTEDYGSDIRYGGDPATTAIGGTKAIADSYAVALIGRYKFTENFSVHGGLRADRARGTIRLDGLAYGGTAQVNPLTGERTGGGVSGYDLKLDSDYGYGYIVGGAFEVPDIALRLAVTYHSAVEHDFKTRERFPLDVTGDGIADTTREVDGGKTNVDTPQAVNIEFQTGIAPETLLFGGLRWQEWSEFKIEPEAFAAATGRGIVSLDDTVTYTLGVGRRFTPAFAASVAYIYEAPQDDRKKSPLAPYTGQRAVLLGASYRFDALELSGGVRYSLLGDAKPATADTARAEFDNNRAVSVGVRLGYYF